MRGEERERRERMEDIMGLPLLNRRTFHKHDKMFPLSLRGKSAVWER